MPHTVARRCTALPSGTLGMKELFTSLGHLAGGSAEEQANFFYNLFSDGSGDAVDLDFIMDKMEQTTEETQEATEKLEALVAELKAASPTGKLSQQDFQAAIQDRPELLHLFHRLLGASKLLSRASVVCSGFGLREA